VAGDYGETFNNEIKHFVEGILHNRDFMKGVRGENAVQDLKVIEAAYRSSKTRSMVQV
jgi:predicted dehydrogenase